MKDATEVEAHRLVEKRKVMAAGKKKAKEKAKRLKQELQRALGRVFNSKERTGN